MRLDEATEDTKRILSRDLPGIPVRFTENILIAIFDYVRFDALIGAASSIFSLEMQIPELSTGIPELFEQLNDVEQIISVSLIKELLGGYENAMNPLRRMNPKESDRMRQAA